MQKIGDYWVPAVDTRGFKRRRKTRADFADSGDGRQITHLTEALALIEARAGAQAFDGAALDCGANVGSYARHMATRFAHVHAFEPAEDTYACLARNIAEWGLGDRVTTYPNALSDHPEGVRMGASFGRRSISRAVQGKGNIPALPLDSFDFGRVTFLKLDVEGYEVKALNGAVRLLAEQRPFVMMEVKEHVVEKGRDPLEAHRHILTMGYALIARIGEPAIDYLYGPA
jgi:FkbM family methyltransferase